MKGPVTLRIDANLFRILSEHLFPGDEDEHGAVIAAGVCETSRGTRLLAREVFLARDGVDYIPGERGYRALTPEFVADLSDYCAAQNLCYLAVHCHGGSDTVSFSSEDLASHRRGYPALLDITNGGPVGALVLAKNAVAGQIWVRNGVVALQSLTVVGARSRTLYPSPRVETRSAALVYDRHARLFGDIGQEILGFLKVGIIGLGGGGSLLSEWLSRLGVGHIIAVDYDRIDITNLPRIVGASRRDALALLAESNIRWFQTLARRFAKHKVHVARRVAREANPEIRFDAIVGSILDESVATLLKDVDFLFLATDTIQSRLIFNALVQQCLIPGAQVGAKVSVDKKNGKILDIFVASRPVLPNSCGGCLECHELIPSDRLQEEALSGRDQKRQRYIDDESVVEPSVICLNVLSAAKVANDLMMMFTGLFDDEVKLLHELGFVRERKTEVVEPRTNPSCLDCSSHHLSRRARGDRVRLPCRVPPKKSERGILSRS
jgi:molybdopterin/thiamine biosynthesis adenylyltransferase